MNGKIPIRLVNVMPKHNPTLALPQLTRATIAILAGGFLLLCASGTTHAAIQEQIADDSFLSPWTYSTIILVLMLAGLVIYKKRRASREWVGIEGPVKSPERAARSENTQLTSSRGPVEAATPGERRAPITERRAPAAERRAPIIEGAQVWERPAPVEVETSVYGAYRIDQEVGKLVLGKPHRMDVMASRAPDDRRAIEASLVKALEAWDNDPDARRHAREALEEYGFVARQSATMLMGRDAWERSSAARTLGQIGSPDSLIFLIEALHDSDSVVRNQAVASLGALKMPAAIGALLDIARRHPDIPAALLSETLSACSVESLGYLDASSEPASFGGGSSSAEPPELGSFLAFEDLPEGSEDEALTESLSKLASSDEHMRAQAISELASRRVQRSVTALSTVALSDPDSGVRSAAVSGLGSIDHESGFATILVALADVSREVRAAAARTLSGLSFDRADAYVRVMETADADTLQNVARACIKTGIVAQAVNRLASEDRHQAYEAFSLLSLLAKGNETQPILDAIQSHKDEEVRLCAIRVLNVAAQPDLAPTLRELASGEGLTDNVRTAILEVLYKLDQDQPVFDLGSSDNGAVSLHNSL
jgi:HEAT repeat protein